MPLNIVLFGWFEHRVFVAIFLLYEANVKNNTGAIKSMSLGLGYRQKNKLEISYLMI